MVYSVFVDVVLVMILTFLQSVLNILSESIG